MVRSHPIPAFFNSSASYCLISDSTSASHFIINMGILWGISTESED